MPRTARKKSPVGPTSPPDRPPLPPGTTLLALDPSSTAIGWAVFVGGQLQMAGLVPAAPKHWDSFRRIQHNAESCLDMIGLLREDHERLHIVTEWQSHLRAAGNPNATGLATLGQGQGYLVALIHERHPDLAVDRVSERTWTRWKSRSCFGMKKEKRAEIIMELVPEYREASGSDKGRDTADSIGIGLWRLGRVGV